MGSQPCSPDLATTYSVQKEWVLRPTASVKDSTATLSLQHPNLPRGHFNSLSPNMLHKFHIFPTSTTSPTHTSFLHPSIVTCGEQYIPGEWTPTFITFSIWYMTTRKCTLVRKRLHTEDAPTSSSYAARAARTGVRWCNCSNLLSRALSRYDFACRQANQLRRTEPTLYSYMITWYIVIGCRISENKRRICMHLSSVLHTCS